MDMVTAAGRYPALLPDLDGTGQLPSWLLPKRTGGMPEARRLDYGNETSLMIRGIKLIRNKRRFQAPNSLFEKSMPLQKIFNKDKKQKHREPM